MLYLLVVASLVPCGLCCCAKSTRGSIKNSMFKQSRHLIPPEDAAGNVFSHVCVCVCVFVLLML